MAGADRWNSIFYSATFNQNRLIFWNHSEDKITMINEKSREVLINEVMRRLEKMSVNDIRLVLIVVLEMSRDTTTKLDES